MAKCVACDGRCEKLGVLGYLSWFRCRFCGLIQSQERKRKRRRKPVAA